MRRKLFLNVILLISISVPIFAGGTGEESLGSEERPIVIAIVLWQSSPDITENIERFLVPLELETGYSIDVVVRSRYSDILPLLRDGTAHLALLPPLAFLVASSQGLLDPGLVADRPPETTGCKILGRPGFSPASFEDIADTRIVRVDPLAQDGWLSAKLVLETYRGGFSREIELVDADSYTGALSALKEGQADIGVFPAEFATQQEEPLPVLAEIEGIPGWGIHFHPSVDKEIRRRLSTALIARSGDPSALGFLNEIFGVTTVSPASEGFSLPFEALLRNAGIDSTDLP